MRYSPIDYFTRLVFAIIGKERRRVGLKNEFLTVKRTDGREFTFAGVEEIRIGREVRVDQPVNQIFVPANVADFENWMRQRGFDTSEALKKKWRDAWGFGVLEWGNDWYVAVRDFEVTPRFGADSRYIIVPSLVSFLGGDLGHSKLCFMDEVAERAYFGRVAENNFFAKPDTKLLRGKVRAADLQDYADWLVGYKASGGKTAWREDSFPVFSRGRWFVATTDFRMCPLYGSDSIYAIVPQGVKFLGGDLGHSSLYFMDDFSIRN